MARREEAVASYQAALRLFPENAVALMQLGNLYLQLNNPEAALDCFQKASAAQPSYAPAHNALGEFFAYKRQARTVAKQHFLHALRLDPDFIPALNNFANLAMASASYTEAAGYFMRVLALDPKFVPAYGNLAFIYSLQGRTAKARSFLNRALQVDPQNARLKGMLEQIEASEKAKTN